MVATVQEAAYNGFPFSSEYIADAVQLVVSLLPPHRQKRLPFKSKRPEPDYVMSFLKKDSEIKIRRRASLKLQLKDSNFIGKNCMSLLSLEEIVYGIQYCES